MPRICGKTWHANGQKRGISVRDYKATYHSSVGQREPSHGRGDVIGKEHDQRGSDGHGDIGYQVQP